MIHHSHHSICLVVTIGLIQITIFPIATLLPVEAVTHDQTKEVAPLKGDNKRQRRRSMKAFEVAHKQEGFDNAGSGGAQEAGSYRWQRQCIGGQR